MTPVDIVIDGLYRNSNGAERRVLAFGNVASMGDPRCLRWICTKSETWGPPVGEERLMTVRAFARWAKERVV